MTPDTIVLIACGLLLLGLTGRVLLESWIAARRYRRLTDPRFKTRKYRKRSRRTPARPKRKP